jgi:hypothetical protein
LGFGGAAFGAGWSHGFGAVAAFVFFGRRVDWLFGDDVSTLV